ncbi:hypothetical protein FWK35_00027917 [Aphis craccivora]|uniref:DUF4817 domain-containing protein n=1 Tax=Aphis craccivora TaxID=307492 RepID=A0A6G0VTI9_APHCR|nr:hypothetical protein FWK35_00027917 [Aphis craccivora]
MLLIYGEAGKSNMLAAALYQQRFPHRKSPAPKTFQYVENCMRRTGRLPNGDQIAAVLIAINTQKKSDLNDKNLRKSKKSDLK